jgi:hypothetical protein
MNRHRMQFQLAASMCLMLMFSHRDVGAIDSPKGNPGPVIEPEILALRSEVRLAEQQQLIRALVSRIGPEAAQEKLLQSGLPFTGESHLIMHTLGTYIYEKFGIAGIAHCSPYFLGACYHGFLLEAVSQHGPEVIPKVWLQCQKTGFATMDQCAHAAGHGLLAWYKHAVKEALFRCDALAGSIDHFTAFNCYDGVFMENVWNLHHHEHGAQPQKMERAPLENPCDASSLEQKYLPACWGNQVTVLYKAFEGDLARIAVNCDALTNDASKESCFNGLARQINPLTHGSTQEAVALCAKASAGKWYNKCLITNAEAAFAVGDEVKMPFEICGKIDEAVRGTCYERLSALIALYAGTNVKRAEQLCANIGERQYRESCLRYDRDFVARARGPMPDITSSSATKQQVTAAVLYRAAPAGTSEIQEPSYPVPYTYPYPDPYTYPYPNPYTYPLPYTYPYPVPYVSPYPVPYSAPDEPPPS